jgi:predicted kinase
MFLYRPVQIGRAYNAEIIGYYLASDLNLCLERNSKRSGKAKIPDIGIHATFKKLVMPSYEEGFDRLFYVAIAAKEKFKIRDWL